MHHRFLLAVSARELILGDVGLTLGSQFLVVDDVDEVLVAWGVLAFYALCLLSL